MRGGVSEAIRAFSVLRRGLRCSSTLLGNQAGDTTITVGANTEEEGILWVKTGAGSFTGRERLVLERYTPPAEGKRPLASLNASNGAARFSLTGDGLASAFDKAISVSTSNKVSVTDASGNDENLKISLSARTGLFTGSVALDLKRRFNLVVLQDTVPLPGFSLVRRVPATRRSLRLRKKGSHSSFHYSSELLRLPIELVPLLLRSDGQCSCSVTPQSCSGG
jgi:hypothetical protein